MFIGAGAVQTSKRYYEVVIRLGSNMKLDRQDEASLFLISSDVL